MSAQSKVEFQAQFKSSTFNGSGTQGKKVGKFLRVPFFNVGHIVPKQESVGATADVGELLNNLANR